MRNAYNILARKLERNSNVKNIGENGRIILESILDEWGGIMWIAFIWLMLGACGVLF
jgi:hypothetical protein